MGKGLLIHVSMPMGKFISTGVTGLDFTTVLFPVTTQHTWADKKC